MNPAPAIALTFDDILLVPRFADFDRNAIDLTSKLTKKISLRIPIVSSPMDTVTEAKLATALARAGGFGFIHRNLTIAGQVAEVKKVKKLGLPVGAAVGSSPGYEERVKQLVGAGVDCILVDSAHGHSQYVIEATRYIKKHFKVEVVSGNVATKEGATALIKAGADGLRVGMGPGAICSTRIVSGMGVPQVSAIQATVLAAARLNVPVIADGGITYSGDITKALATGANCVMLGRILAAASESAGKRVLLSPKQVPARFQSILNGSKQYRFKQYRGMGSIGAMKKGATINSEDEYHGKNYKSDVLVAEGVEGLVPESGSLAAVISQLLGGLQSGMYYTGARTINSLQKEVKWQRITQASLAESHPHDLFITNPGASYR